MGNVTGNPAVTTGNVKLAVGQLDHGVPLSITPIVTKAADVQPQLSSGARWCTLLFAKGYVCEFIPTDCPIHHLSNIIEGRVAALNDCWW